MTEKVQTDILRSMSIALNIRRGRLGDQIAITNYNLQLAWETEHKRLDPYVVLAGVRAVLEDPSKGTYFVAETDDRIVGQLMITHEWSDWRNGDIWWIQSVYVHPDYRKTGIFKTLYHHTRQAAVESGAVMLRLYVEKDNQSAQRVYQNLGMTLSDYHLMEENLPKG
jgi:GNAT superfamily N-acetyltransferase